MTKLKIGVSALALGLGLVASPFTASAQDLLGQPTMPAGGPKVMAPDAEKEQPRIGAAEKILPKSIKERGQPQLDIGLGEPERAAVPDDQKAGEDLPGDMANNVELPNVDVAPYQADLQKIEQLQRQTAVMNARVEYARALKSLRDAQTGGGDGEAETTSSPVLPGMGAAKPQVTKAKRSDNGEASAYGEPVVAGIRGMDGNLRAVVIDPSRGEVVVKPGDYIRVGMKVSSISRDGVMVIDKNGVKRPLNFGTGSSM